MYSRKRLFQKLIVEHDMLNWKLALLLEFYKSKNIESALNLLEFENCGK